MGNYWRKRRRIKLSESQNHRCCYCGVVTVLKFGAPNSATIDHLLPRCMGGPLIGRHNQVMACSRCNWDRQTLDPVDFYVMRQIGLQPPTNRVTEYDQWYYGVREQVARYRVENGL